MARPRKTLPANGLDIIRQAASNGCAETGIARALGMSLKVWRRIREDDPIANEAWTEARAREEEELVGILTMQARGAPAEYDGEGNVIRAERPGQPSAAMFLLKARHGYRDQGEPPTASATAAVQIVMPAQMPLDQIQQMFPNLRPPAASEHAAPAQRA